MVGVFLRDLPASIRTMRQAVANEDVPALHDAAHQLNGAAANMGAVGASALCHQLEHTESDTTRYGVALVDQLELELERAAELLRAELAS